MQITYNENQEKAIYATEPKILCLAGAGTGKTQTLIGRICRLISDQQCKGDEILALTFTNAAAFEMKERFQKISPKDWRVPEFRTFHAFCYRLLYDQHVLERIGYSSVPNICTDHELKHLQTAVKTQLNIKLSDRKLSNPDLLTYKEHAQYTLYRKGLKRQLAKTGVITFDILCSEVCALFATNDPTVQQYKEKYKYIFVDEFQDTDPKQWKFIQSFPDSKLFVVGDALQALYAFRNADSTIIKSLSHDPEWRTIKLYQNYRSTNQICEFANKMSTYADDSYRIEIEGQRDGNDVDMNQSNTDRFHVVSDYMINKICKQIIDLQGRTAILCRTNAEVSYVAQRLIDYNVNTQRSNKNDITLHLIKSCASNDYLISWTSSYLNAEQYGNWLKIENLLSTNSNDPLLKKYCEYCSCSDRVSALLSQEFQLRRILRSEEDSLSSRFFGAAQLLGLSVTSAISAKLTDIIDVPQMMKLLSECAESVAESNIYVGTIHSSKGLEYDNVILVNVDSKSFPLDCEENYNCFYVGITRAKNYLQIYYADEGDDAVENTMLPSYV